MRFYSIIIVILACTRILIAQNLHDNNTSIVIKLKNNSTQKNAAIVFSKIEQITSAKINFEPLFKNNNKDKTSIPEKYSLANIYRIELSNNVYLPDALHQLSQIDEIEYAERYPVSYILETPNDPYIKNQYYLQIIKAFEAFELTSGDTNVVIGIVDTGVDLLHEDLKGNYKYNYDDPINSIDDDGDGYVDNFYGWDVADKDNNPQSLVNTNGAINYHGTKVSGTAAATTNNNIGVASIGNKTKIMPIKAMDASGSITAGYEGIIFAADHGCQIINCSWGNNTYSKFAQDVINYAALYRGCLIVASAGNSSAAIDKLPTTLFYPASYDNVLSVAATGPTDRIWSGSSYAYNVDVSAPGEGIYSTYQSNTYGSGNGTSNSAPLVAGLAGLVKAKHPEFTNKQLAEQIRITSDVIDTLPQNAYYKNKLGYGRINAYKALSIDYLPSIRIDSFSVASNKNSALLNGNILTVSFIAQNYLAQATNTTIELTTTSEFIAPLENSLTTGLMHTFNMVSNTTTHPFTFSVDENIPSNEKVLFEFTMTDAGYSDYQIFEVLINKDYMDISENDISTSLTSNGRIGFSSFEEKHGLGLNYKNEPLLNNAGIIIGTSPEHMASALYDEQEFNTLQIIDTSRNKQSEIVGQTLFSTKPETGLQLEILHTTTFANSMDVSNTLIHTYSIRNLQNEEIENLKMSSFVDWDIIHPNYNLADFEPTLNMAFTYSNANKVIYTGICLLNDLSSVPFAFDLISGEIDITNGFSKELKWITMTNPQKTAGNLLDNSNVASMLSTDYFNLPANETIEIAFAHIIGNNYNDIADKAVILRESYNETNISRKSRIAVEVYPNPATNELNITLNETANAIINIYNIQGARLFTSSLKDAKYALLPIKNLKAGIYTVQIKTKGDVINKKFIKVH